MYWISYHVALYNSLDKVEPLNWHLLKGQEETLGLLHMDMLMSVNNLAGLLKRCR